MLTKEDKLEAKRLGELGERAACIYLESKGYEIITQNYKARHGEIDIIAKDGDRIVFIEVKTRCNGEELELYGRPAGAVTRDKRKNIIYTALWYMRKNKSELCPRFDVVEAYAEKLSKGGDIIYKFKLEHIVSAFTADSLK